MRVSCHYIIRVAQQQLVWKNSLSAESERLVVFALAETWSAFNFSHEKVPGPLSIALSPLHVPEVSYLCCRLPGLSKHNLSSLSVQSRHEDVVLLNHRDV